MRPNNTEGLDRNPFNGARIAGLSEALDIALASDDIDRLRAIDAIVSGRIEHAKKILEQYQPLAEICLRALADSELVAKSGVEL